MSEMDAPSTIDSAVRILIDLFSTTMHGKSLRTYYTEFNDKVSKYRRASEGLLSLNIGDAVFSFLFVNGLDAVYGPVLESLISAGDAVSDMSLESVYGRARGFAQRTHGLSEDSAGGSALATATAAAKPSDDFKSQLKNELMGEISTLMQQLISKNCFSANSNKSARASAFKFRPCINCGDPSPNHFNFNCPKPCGVCGSNDHRARLGNQGEGSRICGLPGYTNSNLVDRARRGGAHVEPLPSSPDAACAHTNKSKQSQQGSNPVETFLSQINC